MRILKHWKREEGVALVIVFVAMATLLLLTTALLQFSTSSMVNSVDNQNKNKARANAEAGAAKLLKNWGTITSVPETPFNGGTYSAVYTVEGGRYYLVATGKSGSSIGVNDWQSVIKCRLFSGLDISAWKYGMFAGSGITLSGSGVKYQGSSTSAIHSNGDITLINNPNVTGGVDVTYGGILSPTGAIPGATRVSPLPIPELIIKDSLVSGGTASMLNASDIAPGKYFKYDGSVNISGNMTTTDSGYAIIVAEGNIVVEGDLNSNNCPVILISKGGSIKIDNFTQNQSSFYGVAAAEQGDITVENSFGGQSLDFDGIMIARGSILVSGNVDVQYLPNNGNINLRSEMTSAFFTNPMIYSWDESYTKL